MKRIILMFMAATLVISLAACQNDEQTPETPDVSTDAPIVTTTPSATPTEPVSPEPEPEPEYTGPRNPLTGLPVDEDISNTRPYAIMLNNLKEALPQYGVSQADIIYEVMAEGGITRMLAVFQDVGSIEGKVGSIRSSRPYYLDLAQGHDAIYIHAGGSEAAYSEISRRGVTNFDFVRSSHAFFFRDPDRLGTYALEHTAFTTGEKMADYIPDYNIRHEHEDGYSYQMSFADEAAPRDGQPADKIRATYSTYKTGVFEYDSETGLYLVSEYSEPYVDGNTGEQVTVKNVLVILADHQVLDSVGRRAVDLVGEGKGYFACDGKYVPITWQKDSYDSQFTYSLDDGSELIFGRGTSYINVMPISSEVIFE